MPDIVWYILYSPELSTHIISPFPPPAEQPVVMQEKVFFYPFPALAAIFDFVSTAEQLRSGGDAAQRFAVKVVMRVPEDMRVPPGGG